MNGLRYGLCKGGAYGMVGIGVDILQHGFQRDERLTVWFVKGGAYGMVRIGVDILWYGLQRDECLTVYIAEGWMAQGYELQRGTLWIAEGRKSRGMGCRDVNVLRYGLRRGG
jgi:hypothetical protein